MRNIPETNLFWKQKDSKILWQVTLSNKKSWNKISFVPAFLVAIFQEISEWYCSKQQHP